MGASFTTPPPPHGPNILLVWSYMTRMNIPGPGGNILKAKTVSVLACNRYKLHQHIVRDLLAESGLTDPSKGRMRSVEVHRPSLQGSPSNGLHLAREHLCLEICLGFLDIVADMPGCVFRDAYLTIDAMLIPVVRRARFENSAENHLSIRWAGYTFEGAIRSSAFLS